MKMIFTIVGACFLYYESESESGDALDYFEDRRNHDSSMRLARLVLSWEQIRNDLAKAIQNAVKTGKEKKDDDDEVCVICLEEYQGEDMIGTMVACKHNYHEDCIKKWLIRNTKCAICRLTVFGNYSS
ncbi:putative transcription factor C2H2 family [Helianthus annuus]|nr:putative transcription factor C2H2 family [Helianthus annuus]